MKRVDGRADLMKRFFLALGLVALAGLAAAATITHTVIVSYQAPSGVVTGTITVTNDTELNESLALASSDVAKELDVTINQTNLQSICFYSPQSNSITPYNGATAGTVISLSPGVPLIWYRASGGTCPLATNVTKFLINNTSGVASSLQCFAVMHTGVP